LTNMCGGCIMPPMQKDDAAPPVPKDKSKSLTLRPIDQARMAALRHDSGVDNDVDVIRFALAEACRSRGLEVADPTDGAPS
jgi:hypothetical protein